MDDLVGNVQHTPSLMQIQPSSLREIVREYDEEKLSGTPRARAQRRHSDRYRSKINIKMAIIIIKITRVMVIIQTNMTRKMMNYMNIMMLMDMKMNIHIFIMMMM